MLAHERQCVAKGWQLLCIPRHLTYRQCLTLEHSMRKPCDERKHPQQHWCRTRERQIRPLALCFDPQMRASSKVTSICQRITNHSTICSGVSASLVLSSACGSNVPCGSRINSQRTLTSDRPLCHSPVEADACSRPTMGDWPPATWSPGRPTGRHGWVVWQPSCAVVRAARAWAAEPGRTMPRPAAAKSPW